MTLILDGSVYVKNSGDYIMNFNIRDDEKYYLEKIKEKLIVKYHLNDIDALEKLKEYDFLSEIIEFDTDCFFYQSPEYWADYLME